MHPSSQPLQIIVPPHKADLNSTSVNSRIQAVCSQAARIHRINNPSPIAEVEMTRYAWIPANLTAEQVCRNVTLIKSFFFNTVAPKDANSSCFFFFYSRFNFFGFFTVDKSKIIIYWQFSKIKNILFDQIYVVYLRMVYKLRLFLKEKTANKMAKLYK